MERVNKGITDVKETLSAPRLYRTGWNVDNLEHFIVQIPNK